ncbi:MAG: DUF2155 domain-containing protein [Ghiorsea sp.]
MSLAIFLTACDREETKTIEWQLPLSVPTDPHASSKGNQLPEWATLAEGKATVFFLEKSTTRTFEVEIRNGNTKKSKDWTIQLQGLAQGLRIKDHTFINDENMHNPAGFVTLHYRDAVMYEGWLYQDFPELFGMDNSDWKVRIKEVTMPPSSQEDDTLLP